MRRSISLLLALFMLMSTLLLTACSVEGLLDFIFNNKHEHDWHNWMFDYTDSDVQVVCACGEVVETHPVSKGLEIKDGVLISIGTCTDSMIVVPNGVAAIGEKAFKHNSSITGILLPNTIKVIGASAFEKCSELQMINIPEGVLTIERKAFKKCTKLSGVLLPESLASIGTECFADCPLFLTLYYRGNTDGWNNIVMHNNWNGNNIISNIPNYKDWGKDCAHEWGEWIKVSEANCFSSGEMTRVCSKCRKLQRGHIALQHEVEEGTEAEILLEPTCISSGYQIKRCVCGEPVQSTITPRLDHNVETSLDGGKLTVFCNDCNEVVLTCDYIEGSKGLEIIDGVVYGIGSCTDTDIVIPSYYDGYAVTEINWNAFSDNKKIKSVIIPDSVMVINSDAFEFCDSLETVVIGKNTYIASGAFRWCKKIKYITLSDKFELDALSNSYSSLEYNIYNNGKYIGNADNPYMMLFGFENTEATELEIHEDTKFISGLSILKKIKNISISEDNEYFKTIDGVLYSKDGKTLIAYPKGKEEKRFVVPDGVVELLDDSFYDSNLENVVLPNSLKIIGSSAFSNCFFLSDVNIPTEVEFIGSNAFNNCRLSSVVLPDGVRFIGSYTFANCSGLKSISIPDSVTIIGDDIATIYDYGFLTINYAGTQKQWYDISKSYRWDYNIADMAIEFSDGVFSGDHIHEYGSWAVAKLPSQTETGIKERVCKCGNVEQEIIPINYYSEELEFTLSSDGTYYTVSGIGSCSETFIIIPNVYRGLPVTGIGDQAFVDCTSLASISIPVSVTSIGEYAFSNCNSLKSITIPASVTSIGYNAFFYCHSINSITFEGNIPSYNYSALDTVTEIILKYGVSSIPDYAFYSCKSLESITIPDSVTSIGDSAFSECTSLENIEVDENNANYQSIDGNVYSKDGKTFILYAPGKFEKTFVIPDSVTSIGSSAFSCQSLVSITIPNSVTDIGSYAFAGCTSLISIEIPDSVTKIANGTFASCTSLTSIEIPGSVTSIGESAFTLCKSLSNLTIPNSVTSIGQNAFNNCDLLTSIIIPESVKHIGYFAFSGCTALESIVVDENNKNYKSIDGNIYRKDGIAFILYLPSKQETSFVIPDHVSIIDDFAFSSCASLTSITIPDSVTSIGNFAFFNCKSLTSIFFEGTVDQWNAMGVISTGFNSVKVICSNGTIILE